MLVNQSKKCEKKLNGELFQLNLEINGKLDRNDWCVKNNLIYFWKQINDTDLLGLQLVFGMAEVSRSSGTSSLHSSLR